MNALSNLKYDFIVSLDNTSPYTIRLMYRRTEVLTAALLTLTYASFTDMMLNRRLSMMPNHSYEDAEKLSMVFKSIFNHEIKPEDTLHDRDNCVNESLEHYETMCVFINKLEEIGYNKEDIMAFCKQVEYSNKELGRFKAEVRMHYHMYATALFFYLTDKWTYEELTSCFIEINIFTRTVSPPQLGLFIREMRKVLDLFYEIAEIREIRASKRHLEG